MPAGADIQKRAARDAANWHLGWGLALALGAATWPGGYQSTMGEALACAAAPGFVGQLVRWRAGGFSRLLVALAWPLGVGAAIAMSGGAGGPLLGLALAPASAMAAMDARRLLALGVALTLATTAGVAIASAAGFVQPAPTVGPWLPLGAISLAAVGLAAALQMIRVRSDEREAAEAGVTTRLRALLERAPVVLLRIDRGGIVRELIAGGRDDPGGQLMGQPFTTIAGEPHRWAADAALDIARREGSASVGLAPPMA
ncbi:MAG TPA: hypothetical protein VMU37_05455, partial [Caulobacteraceae bacterium]|nr:hypothetical protein [Caulobacteraceae bacterium]